MEFDVWPAQLTHKIPAGVGEFWDCKGLDFPPRLRYSLARKHLRLARGGVMVGEGCVVDKPQPQ